MELETHLSFNGNCEEAFKFYEKAIGAKILFMLTHENSPMADKTPPGLAKKIMHATIQIGRVRLMGADTAVGKENSAAGYSLSLGTTDPAEAERLFNALSENGKVGMPLQETFWAIRFGYLVDQFGIPWMINCEKPQQPK